MNKLLFYIDFLSYRELGMAMSGLSYRAIEFGPVPNNWDKVYSQFDEIQQLLRPCGDFEGSVLFSPEIPDVSIFSSGELAVLQAVCSRFYNCSSREISAISHEEKAWIDNCEQHGGISFSSAFELKVL